MKRIWSVIHEKTGKRWWFENYSDAIMSVRSRFGNHHQFPTPQQVTDTTRIGFAPTPKDWIQIDAVPLNTNPINL